MNSYEVKSSKAQTAEFTSRADRICLNSCNSYLWSWRKSVVKCDVYTVIYVYTRTGVHRHVLMPCVENRTLNKQVPSKWEEKGETMTPRSEVSLDTSWWIWIDGLPEHSWSQQKNISRSSTEDYPIPLPLLKITSIHFKQKEKFEIS